MTTDSTTAPVADVLDCGHPPTPDPTGIGTGRAIDPTTGATSCYPCSNEREREAMTRANTFVAYKEVLDPYVARLAAAMRKDWT